MKTALTLLSVALLVSVAGAATVDFNSYSPLDTCMTPISSGGLDFTGNVFCTGVWTANPNGNGTPSLINGYGGIVSITQTGGGAFNLSSFDMTISWYDSNPTENVNVTANFWGGGSSSQTITLIQGLQSYNLGLSNLASVDVSPIAGGYWLMDNVVYSNTPEPGTIALLGSGMLAGIGVLRRKMMI